VTEERLSPRERWSAALRGVVLGLPFAAFVAGMILFGDRGGHVGFGGSISTTLETVLAGFAVILVPVALVCGVIGFGHFLTAISGKRPKPKPARAALTRGGARRHGPRS
jgi:hypothetical protein